MANPANVNLPQLAPLAGRGPRLWRSLEEYCQTDEFRRMVERDYPSQAQFALDSLTRRKFLSLMGASLALAGAAGCSVSPAPVNHIVPYVRRPEEVIPGKPLYYATAMQGEGGAVGLLVETHEGRPTKIEGNPAHPASLGAAGPIQQASVLELYDPDRSQAVQYLGATMTWDDAVGAIRQAIAGQKEQRGRGLRLLTEPITSPTLREQLDELLGQMPEARWHVFGPATGDARSRAARAAYGGDVQPRLDFKPARVVVSLDSDFLSEGPGWLRYAADFISQRRVTAGEDDAASATMNRLYVVEPAVTPTGAKADHRLAARGTRIEAIAVALARGAGVTLDAAAGDTELSERERRWVDAAAKDLAANRGQSIVVVGDRQPQSVQLLAIAINDQLGNVGKTVEYIAPPHAAGDSTHTLQELVIDIEAGRVECLVILGGNPVYHAPADVPLAERLAKVPLRIRLGIHEDETSRRCQWHLPQAHFLESWSDTRAYDGTATIMQPAIEPLHEGRSVHEVVALLAGARETNGRAILRSRWAKEWKHDIGSGKFETRWMTALHDGVVEGTRAEARSVTLKADWQSELKTQVAWASAHANNDSRSHNDTRGLKPTLLGTLAVATESPRRDDTLPGPLAGPRPTPNHPGREVELHFALDPSIRDGRFANNGWLQELPKPITKITWGNAAIMSPATADRLGLSMGSYAHGGERGGYHMPVVRIAVGERGLEAPLWIMPGHADDAVTLHLGFGRTSAGRVGGSHEETVGVDASQLRLADQPWFVPGAVVTDTGRTELVACTQAHHQMEERDPVRTGTLERFHHQPKFPKDDLAKEHRDRTLRASEPTTLYGEQKYEPPLNKWGMVIDLTACVGCNACVAACVAENNIPVIGKDEVARGRAMHWIRVDRYVSGEPDDPDAFHFQPLPCMHCENAPCEYVCPTEATVHSADGLNDMIYNRCVGTRFCSNNCPYKVRRFNFLAYSDFDSPARRMQYNPDVTVRSRGVMEKCTYCVQRIRQAQIGAETSGKPLQDGDVLTACQAACPTDAIIFGDLNDEQSKVSRASKLPLQYALLDDELNTRPRTTYLAELRNPSTDMAPPATSGVGFSPREPRPTPWHPQQEQGGAS